VAYILSLFILASAVNLTILSGWGAPHGTSLFYCLNQCAPVLSIGQWSWVMQAVGLVVLILIVRQVHVHYFLSFITSVLYGIALDASKLLFAGISVHTFPQRLLCFVIGFLLLGAGLQILIKCDMPMVVFDLIVKEVTRVKQKKLGVVKTIFDVTVVSLTAGIGLVVFGRLVGLGIGTVLLALFTGAYIQSIDGLVRRVFEFRPLLFGRKPKQQQETECAEETGLTEGFPPENITNDVTSE
jgi:uncharacterized membrane protein YczE